MPRGNAMGTQTPLLHAMILAEEKAGKTSWLLAAAESGFNVLLLDGDVAGPRIHELSEEAKSRVYYMDVSDDLVGDGDPRMIQIVADFFTSSKYLWNDTKQRQYSRTRDEHDEETGACKDEIWEFKPALLDRNWVLGIDSWTTLSYSGMLAKGQDLGVNLADIEKAEQNMYQGVGNRLTNIAITQQKARCHTVIIGHPSQYEKLGNPSGERLKNVKQGDKIVEWTKMIPKSSSNPHGYSLGKYFSDIGWIDVNKFGKRELNFLKTSERTSGGNLNSKGDPRVDHRFEDIVRATGGYIPDGKQGTGPGLTIHPPGTFIPAVPQAKANPLGKKPASSPVATPVKGSTVKGLGGLVGLNTQPAK
jgi:hypothetical protein